ncbi:hypothetical protein CONCODRAFT_9110 [Conidiobolus coronatus NRRL 28638]|uniref:F-box domain-containing protein n=1 Tax=Conidiobolus coronatus (strain ATCC 28846 / CBS 209.66 / NRRL 28638) TaxID=796925 RepID=A0A137P0G9_CONC2|nr:hypothetical protein CONCODRAFT_9110 [Conidiobolus coronatus NRRL 28638]|eukprot:KXN68590.1 hypothetical protein CONCODRAFT_9110 [Conidiobolus coronatus NRRL 28638]
MNKLSKCSVISINLLKSATIKKLNVICDSYTESSLNSILTKCSRLKELEIKLPSEWKDCMKIIGRRCCDLEQLTVSPPSKLRDQKLDTLRKELYELEFAVSSSLYKSNLKKLTLNQFNIYNSKAGYFNNFLKLRYIEYPKQIKPDGRSSNIEANFDKGLWPNYRFDKKVDKCHWDAKLVKL